MAEEQSPRGLARLVAWPRVAWIAVALTLACAAPAIGAGWFLDDYMYLARIADGPPGWRAAAEIYRLTAAHGGAAQAILHGDMPWWLDTHAKVELCRPLAGVLFGADVALFGRQVWAAHLHSLAWYLVLLLAAGLLLRRLDGAAGGLALLLFAVDDSHWQAIGWLSNRHAVIAAAPVLLGLCAHLRWRQRGWRLGLPLSLAGYALGLLGGETALQALAYLVGWELLGARDGWRRRLVGLTPALLLLAAYFVGYRALGFGAHGHEQYLDPLREPGRFITGATTRLPTLLADLFGGLPADLWPVLPALRPVYVGVGVGALALMAALLGFVWGALGDGLRRELRWLLLGAAGSLVPGLAGLPGSRLLLVPSLGGAALVAVILCHLGPALARRGGWRRVLGVGARGWLVFVHGVAAPALLVVNFVNMRTVARATEQLTREAEVEAGTQPAAQLDVAVLYAPDLVALLYPPSIYALDARTRWRSWWTLSIAKHDHDFVRTGERSFILALRDGTFFEDEWERLFRARGAQLRPGERVRLAGLEVELLSPSQIAVVADRPLDDPSLRILAWQDGRLRRVTPPPIGGRLTIRRSPGLLGL